MKENIRNILRENLQQADKIYFNTGKLPKEARQPILSITNGDVYTKLIADLVFHFSRFGSDLTSGYKLGQKLYKQIKEYDKNLLPLPYNILDFNAEDSGKHIMNLMEYLEYRERAIFYLRQLPSTLVRNLKPELRKPVTHQYDFQQLAEKLKELWGLVKHIPETEKGEKALKKIAASNNSIDDMIELANHFAYAFNSLSDETTEEEVLETAEEFDLKVLQNSNDIIMLKVDKHEAMKALGCTSTWCFSLPNSDEFWDDYASATGYVIVIFDFKQDFDDSTFLMVYLPDRGDVYSATNVPLEQLGIEASNEYLQKIGVDMSKLYEPDAPEPHYDPNQLSLDLKENKNLIKKLFRESFGI